VSDAELRAAERYRNDAPARYLKARLRAGTLMRDQLALAASAGHAPAIEVIGQATKPLPESATQWHPGEVFRKFVPDSAALTAAIAAARAVQLVTCFEHRRDCTRSRCTPIRAVIDAATRYRDDPTTDNQATWNQAVTQIGEWLALVGLPGMDGDEQPDGNDTLTWLPMPYCPSESYREDVMTAVEEAGLTPVRQEVRRQLIEWALSGAPDAHTAARSDDQG